MDPKSLVQNLDRLVSLPDVCIKVNQLLGTSDYSVVEVADIITQDADISARLLRLVNSPLFGQRAKVETLSRAVTLIGANELRNLVMATAAQRTFTGIPEEMVNMTDFWHHSVTTGVMAKTLAEQSNVLHSERLLVMGVLHDLGRLVIYLSLPDESRDILHITGGDTWILADTEQEILGFNHLDVGAELMRSWHLPESFIEVAGFHNAPANAKEYRLEVALVHIAKAVANGHMVGLSVDEMLWAIDPSAWDTTGFSHQDVSALVTEMIIRSEETMDMIIAPARRAQA
ncbi:HDOD domain-containing protein [Candidatus Thiodiazotropha endoloripes]|uniref:HDOD domain-containing protein n=1 Tax=Candidatus Thiodiazotropha endoloripes TaxID=1818881 RepID=UPI000904314E|nr:HDOD domain-containing protein [Candidatus Thiodiazotropha endoloripes]